MKTLVALLVLLGLAAPAPAQTKAVVLTASATSSAPGSAAVTCLLDPACQGTWTPGSLDNGVDEGIFLQFEQAIAARDVEIELASSPASPYDFKVYVNGKTKDSKGTFYFLNEGANPGALALSGLQDPVKSLFLKIDRYSSGGKVQVRKIRFLQGGQPVAFVLPVAVPAQVTATSVLDPQTAYHPAHLFDAKTDFAWATDGKKNDGRGESLRLQLSPPQDIAGLIVWNGYQRSENHFRSNGRPSQVEIKPANGAAQTIALADTMGPQKISLPSPMTGASDLTFTLKAVLPGSKYKDALISEMRLVTTGGQILLPQAALPQPAAPAAWAPLIDRSLTSFLFQPVGVDVYEMTFLEQRLRLRSDGSFVIYKIEDSPKKRDSRRTPTHRTAEVLEGNWEPVTAGIRIFGKKYPTILMASEYLKEALPTAEAAIFQSELKLKRYADLAPGDKQALLTQLWTTRKGPANKAQAVRWDHCSLSPKLPQAGGEVAGANQAAVFASLDGFLKGANPYVIQSTMLSDVLLPTEDVVDCSTGP